MEQDIVTNPEPVAEEAAPETEVTEEEVTEGEEQEQPEAAPDDDFEDVEWEGKSFKAPKGAKSAMMMHSDYTQKTQGLAAERKAWASSIEANRAFTKDVGRLMHLNDQLQQYEQVDWQAWHANNPQAAQNAHFNYQTLRDQRDQLWRGIESRSQQESAQAEQAFATHMSQETAALSKPDSSYGWDGKFTPERQAELNTFAKSIGYSDEALARVNAKDVKTLHLAKLGQEYLKQQRAAAKQTKAEANPVPKVGGGRGNITGNPADMDMERYAQWRKAGGGERRR